ncbi:unnamed protein product [Cuscuta campestris]|uniref:Reverse transcriptase zinc-binding domain-containing protein n=1 Tax=Cuscuta campestris TaxID=132261 RepID=A0A484MPS6_9ASTE|nr:unnamed protein product [Cuscuta campestris]
MKRIQDICRNFIWSATASYKRSPLINWEETCLPKNKGGIGLKNLVNWNKANVMKLLWDVANRKDILWVRWVHGRYLKQETVWQYNPKGDVCYYWRKMLKKVSQWAGTDLTAGNIKEMEDKIVRGSNRKERKRRAALVAACFYIIWKARNNIVHGKKRWNAIDSVEYVKYHVTTHVKPKNLLGVPIAPLDLAPSTTLHNPTSKDMESVERTIHNSVRVLEVANDGVSVEGIVNAFPLDLVVVDTPVDAPDHANKVESEYWVSPRAAKFVFALLAYAHRYTPICRLNEDLTSSGHSLWVIIFSPVLKHEWEPPP